MTLTVISLGAGVQSTTMALMAAHGEIGPMPDAAIFADTQAEPKAVYEHLAWLKTVLPFPVHEVTAGNLWESASTVRRTRDGQRSYIKTAIPVFMVDGLRRGRGQRHCTQDFKIRPVNRKIREMAGLRAVMKKHGVIAELWIGISADEAGRAKPNILPYLRSRWPLLELNMDRFDCLEWMAAHDYPVPPRSACTFCPFHGDNEWLALTPDEFADAVQKEGELQAVYDGMDELTSTPFFHEKRIPLSEVKMVAKPETRKAKQINMFNNDCIGMCGV